MDPVLRELLIQRIAELAPGSRFNLPALLANEWPNQAGVARQLGRQFRAHLVDFEGTIDAGRDNENLRWYQKL